MENAVSVLFTCATLCQLDALRHLRIGLDEIACNTFTVTDSNCTIGVVDAIQIEGSPLNVWSLPPGN